MMQYYPQPAIMPSMYKNPQLCDSALRPPNSQPHHNNIIERRFFPACNTYRNSCSWPWVNFYLMKPHIIYSIIILVISKYVSQIIIINSYYYYNIMIQTVKGFSESIK